MTDIINVVIPTRNRRSKLDRMLSTIPDNDFIKIHIACDGDQETADYLKKERPDINTTFFSGHNGAVVCRNKVLEEITEGHILYAVDDIEFRAECIEIARESLLKHFPDSDGVIGIHQEGNAYHPTGMGLVGEKFLKRYPDNHLFNPDYFHFACQEIHWLAVKHNKFYAEKKAAIYHWHPCHHRSELDQAHVDARVYKSRDMELIKERESKGLIWGDE